MEKKKRPANSDEKEVCSANCKKNENFVHKVAEKYGVMGGGICLFLCLGRKKLFLVRSEKKKGLLRGKRP